MATVTIIGGHGKIALLTHPLLQAQGHQVNAVIRNPDHAAEVERAGATAVVTDIETLDTAGFTDLLTGSDVVIWSAGAGGGDPRRTTAVDQDAAVRSIDAAVAAGVKRYLMVSYFGAQPEHGVPQDNPFHAYAEAKAAADAHLRSAEISATILGPSGLTEAPGTGHIAAVTGFEGGELEADTVSRADVAAVIAHTVQRALDDATDAGLAGVTIRFNNGSEPIEQALDAIADGSAAVGR